MSSTEDESWASGVPCRVQATCGVGVPWTLQWIFAVLPSSRFFEAGCGANLSFSMIFRSILLEEIGVVSSAFL